MTKSTNVFTILGTSSHAREERQQQDYYATDPKAAEILLQVEDFLDIWECASGEDHLANVFRKHGYNVRTSDIVKRTPTTEEYDFLSMDNTSWGGGYHHQSSLQVGNRVHL